MERRNHLEGKTLAEKQMYYYNGTKCIYCNGDTNLVDSIEVYQESYGLLYICRPCKAWVNCHSGGDQSFGTVAKKDLRDLRHECHKWLDPLWMKKVGQGVKLKAARAAAYAWASELLGISTIEGHIGFWQNEQCEKVIAECKKYYLSPEQKAEVDKEKKYRCDLVLSLSLDMEFKVEEFKINAMHHLRLKHPSGKIFVYDINLKTGAWEAKKKKWNKIDSIEDFIIDNFS